MLLLNILDAYEEKYVPQTIDQSRTKSCLRQLRAIEGEVEALTYQKLLEYRKVRVSAGVSESTANKDIAILGSALKWARQEGLTTANPELPRTRETRRIKVMTFPQVERLLENAPDVKTWAFISLLFYTAQRKQAVLKLKHSQIRDGVIHFADQEGPLAHRRKRRATTPLGNKVKAVLNRLKGEYGNTEYVIPKGLDGCYSSFEKPFALAAKNARLSWVTPHVLRHTACSLLLKQKRTMVEASQFLGHSSVAITQSYYAHFDPEFLKGATQALDSL